MNCPFFAVVFLCSILQSICQHQCPAIFLRYSTEHSYCKAKNPFCPIYHAGVTSEQRMQIVDLHNKYRNFVAMGNEARAGGLPGASDMLQMVWDSELEIVAQKRAEQCIYGHDCNNCREVENFAVGQNIAFLDEQCFAKCLNFVPDWNYVIKQFYDEVAIFDGKYVKSMAFSPGKVYGHFTQIVWSKTWRVGCGYVAFEQGNGYRQLYFCNYGPSGNILNHPIYTAGTPCSACPINSCCGRLCADHRYEGLCQMNRIDESPLYRPEGNYIFYCDFRTLTGDCSTSVDVPKKWKQINALGGPYVEVILSSGETSTITFKNMLKPMMQTFCLIVNYRVGPAVDGQMSSHSAFVGLEMPNQYKIYKSLPKPPNKAFFNYQIMWNWRSFDPKVSITFSVPKGYPDQYFNIQLVAATNGVCLPQI